MTGEKVKMVQFKNINREDKNRGKEYRALPILIGFMVTALAANCSFSLPPVTLTTEKTSMEKQIVGEEQLIERDVWLIASARTSKAAEEKNLSDINAEARQASRQLSLRMFQALRTLEFFREEVRTLQNNFVLGEDKNANLVVLPPLAEAGTLPQGQFEKRFTDQVKEKYYSEAKQEEVKDIVQRVNKAREDLVEASIAALDPKLNKATREKEADKIRQSLRSQVIKSVSKGNWLETPGKGWTLKK